MVVLFLTFLACVTYADAHGYMTKPLPRNFIRWAEDQNFGNPQGLNEQLPGTDEDVAACGAVTGEDFTRSWVAEPSSLGWDPSDDTLLVGFRITAHHFGYFETRICDSSAASVECFQGSDKLLNRTVKTSESDLLPVDPQYPWRYYIGPPGLGWVNGTMNISEYPSVDYDIAGPVPISCPDQLDGACRQRPYDWQGIFENPNGGFSQAWAAPPGDTHEWKVKVSRTQREKCGDHCVVQIMYITANSCQPPGLATFFTRTEVKTRIQRFPEPWNHPEAWYRQLSSECTDASVRMDTWQLASGSGPEKFWNCADVRPPSYRTNLVLFP